MTNVKINLSGNFSVIVSPSAIILKRIPILNQTASQILSVYVLDLSLYRTGEESDIYLKQDGE